MVLKSYFRQIYLSVIVVSTLLLSSTHGFSLLAADSLKNWMNIGPPFPLLLIDIRDTSEVASGVIANFITHPYHMSWKQFVFRDSVSKLPKDMAIVLYCASGNRSGQASKYLDSLQYTKVFSLVGGFNEWNGGKGNKTSFKSLASMPEASLGSVASIDLLKKAAPTPILLIKKMGHQKYIYTSSNISPIHHMTIYNSLGTLVLKYDGNLTSQNIFVLPQLQNASYFACFSYQNKQFTQILKLN